MCKYLLSFTRTECVNRKTAAATVPCNNMARFLPSQAQHLFQLSLTWRFFGQGLALQIVSWSNLDYQIHYRIPLLTGDQTLWVPISDLAWQLLFICCLGCTTTCHRMRWRLGFFEGWGFPGLFTLCSTVFFQLGGCFFKMPVPASFEPQSPVRTLYRMVF